VSCLADAIYAAAAASPEMICNGNNHSYNNHETGLG